jgi:hypothetical protein
MKELLTAPPECRVYTADKRQFRPYESCQGVVIGYTEIPRQCIEKIVVNTRAFNLLPANFHWLLDTDTITAHTRMPVPLPKAWNTLLAHHIGGRTLPELYGKIPYGLPGREIVGGMVMGKGFPSGFLHQQKFKKGMQEYIYVDAPYGFWGDRDAQREMKVSTNLVEVGYRSGMLLWYVVLDPVRTKAALLHYWRDTAMGQLIEVSIDKVLKNGDQLVYGRRIGGVPLRLISQRAGDPPISAQVMKGALAWRTELLLQQATDFPDSFRRYCQLVKPRVIVPVLRKICTYQKLDRTEYRKYVQFISGIMATNTNSLNVLLKTHPEYKKSNIILLTSMRKDVCFGLFHQDYEEIDFGSFHPDQSSPTTNQVENRFSMMFSLV